MRSPFIIVVSQMGEFLNIEDTRDAERGRKKGRTFTLPEAQKRTSAVLANLLWDRPDYALGWVPAGKEPDRIAAQHEAFRARIEEVFGRDPTDPAARAVLTFSTQRGLRGRVDPPPMG